MINPYELNLVAHQPGFTTLAVWDTQGRYSEREIRVDESGKQQVLLNVIVAELNRSRIENFGINWSMALPRWNISLVNMAGGVATPYTATSALTANSLISSNPPVTVSTTAAGTLPPNGTLIPLLLSQNLTYGLAAGNDNIQTQSFFQFLEENSMGKILAEPHLLANSGEKAEFLSGGEIPIVISQALNTSIVFKQFGTSVIFVPTVIGFDDILLKVKPEVSEPNFAEGVNLFGFTVPAFVTRRAETMVRLKEQPDPDYRGPAAEHQERNGGEGAVSGRHSVHTRTVSQYQLQQHADRSRDDRDATDRGAAAVQWPGHPADRSRADEFEEIQDQESLSRRCRTAPFLTTGDTCGRKESCGSAGQKESTGGKVRSGYCWSEKTRRGVPRSRLHSRISAIRRWRSSR